MDLEIRPPPPTPQSALVRSLYLCEVCARISSSFVPPSAIGAMCAPGIHG